MKPVATDRQRTRGPRHHRRLVASALTLVFLAGAAPVTADSYDSSKAGHPLRVAAYVLHPVGVILDTLIFRPAHWLVSRRPLDDLFGHRDR